MLIVECAQGSDEWHQARAGVITASMFRVARSRVGRLTEQQQKFVAAVLEGRPEKEAAELAGYKAVPRSDIIGRAIAGEQVAEFSDPARDYAFRLAIERGSGRPLDEGFETWQMRRGQELEPRARMEHEVQTGLVVQRAGFVLTDDRLFGASADGLIGEDGGSEYKCLVSPEKLRGVFLDGDFSDYVDQVQGCLWLTGRRWWDFCVYCPALEGLGRQLWRRRVLRDDDYIDAMVGELLEFEQLVTRYEAALRSGAAPAGER